MMFDLKLPEVTCRKGSESRSQSEHRSRGITQLVTSSKQITSVLRLLKTDLLDATVEFSS